jgi:hypothetical protein
LGRPADQHNILPPGEESWIVNAGMEEKRSKVITELDLQLTSDVQVLEKHQARRWGVGLEGRTPSKA